MHNQKLDIWLLLRKRAPEITFNSMKICIICLLIQFNISSQRKRKQTLGKASDSKMAIGGLHNIKRPKDTLSNSRVLIDA